MGQLRKLAIAAAVLAISGVFAHAADMPEFLRSSYTPAYSRWQGFYAGGQIGRSFVSADFGNASSSLVSAILVNTELQGIVANFNALSKASTGRTSFGGFVGYNWQTDDVLLGAELNYNHISGGALTTSNTIGPILVPGASLPDGSTVLYSVILTSGASVTVQDVATLRGRAGWSFDRFLPYGFVGVAIGRTDVMRFATLAGSTKTTTPSGGGPPVTGTLILPRDPQSEGRTDLIVYGFTAGLGLDVELLPNVFARAEWEFVQFPNVKDVRVSVNSARVGLGVKF
jgi:opacity protein-like surface antigen